MTENAAFLTTIREAAQSDWSEFDGSEVLELIKIIDTQSELLDAFAPKIENHPIERVMPMFEKKYDLSADAFNMLRGLLYRD